MLISLYFLKFRYKLIGREEYKQIDSICLFRDEIPPLTECIENSNGGQYHYSWMEIKSSDLEGLWLDMCARLVTGEGISAIDNVNYILFKYKIGK